MTFGGPEAPILKLQDAPEAGTSVIILLYISDLKTLLNKVVDDLSCSVISGLACSVITGSD